MSPRGPGRRRNVHGQLPKAGEAVNAAHGHQASASAVTFNVSAEGTGMGATARGGASGSGVWTWMATSARPRPARPAPAPRAPPRPPFRWSPPRHAWVGGGLECRWPGPAQRPEDRGRERWEPAEHWASPHTTCLVHGQGPAFLVLGKLLMWPKVLFPLHPAHAGRGYRSAQPPRHHGREPALGHRSVQTDSRHPSSEGAPRRAGMEGAA